MNQMLNDLYLSQNVTANNPVLNSLISEKRKYIEKMQESPKNVVNYWDSIQVLNSRINYLYQKLGIPPPAINPNESIINSQLKNEPINKEYMEQLLKAYANTTHSFMGGGGQKYRKLIDDLENTDYLAFGGIIKTRLNNVKNKIVREKAANTINVIDKLYSIYKSGGNTTSKLNKFENVLKESNNYNKEIIYSTVRGLSKKIN